MRYSQYDEGRDRQLEGVLTYDKTFAGRHHFNFVGGVSQLYLQDLGTRSEAEGASSDLIWTLNAAPLKLDASTNRTEDALLSQFGRISYDFNKKYLLGASLRRDGSSRFAEDNRWGYFPGVSAGWVVSEEEFLKSVSAINTLKLKTSYGQTGNNEVVTIMLEYTL
ncbi:MAG: TonB-dependent receptor [Bacteroidales bacterium]|nr:TonB-dependent receptor [Bacteroidales bacterium]